MHFRAKMRPEVMLFLSLLFFLKNQNNVHEFLGAKISQKAQMKHSIKNFENLFTEQNNKKSFMSSFYKKSFKFLERKIYQNFDVFYMRWCSNSYLFFCSFFICAFI